MSYFQKTITVAANTPISDPMTEVIEVQAGVIHRIRVSIPAGHAWLTGVHVLQGLHQIAPTSTSEWFSGDDDIIDYNEFIELKSATTQLMIEAYNTDTEYAHSFAVNIGVMPRFVVLPQEIIAEMLQAVSSILSALGKYVGMTK